MANQELDRLVAIARDRKNDKLKALRGGDLHEITTAARAYHEAFDQVKHLTKWSLTKLFAVINDGENY